MPAYKDNRQGTWYASFYFENWQGVKQKKLKRGFACLLYTSDAADE